MVDVPRVRSRRRRTWFLAGAVILVGFVLSTLGLASLGPPALDVPRDAVRIAEVTRAPLVRAVRGPGTLVPQDVRWVTAVTPARVEQILVQAGTAVESGVVLLVLSNPDLELAALEARSELFAAEAELANLQAALDTERLTQEGTVAAVTADQAEASRTATANQELSGRGALAGEEVARSRDRAQAFETRLKVERTRLDVLGRAGRARAAAQRARVEQLRAVAEFRARQLVDLEVKAPSAGVLQELPVQVGQWIMPGTVLAKVVDPSRLEARLRIPEVQAKDVAVGQPAVIDTRNGVVRGEVARVEPTVDAGTVPVTVRFIETLPRGARPDLSVDGRVELERIDAVVQVARPANVEPGQALNLFRLDARGDRAERVRVELGRASVDKIEVVSGLDPGDRVIVSDTTAWDDAQHIRLH